MRKILTVVICLACLVVLLGGASIAQIGPKQPYRLYLPLAFRSATMAGYWSVIVPEATVNYFDNPSFETGVVGWTLAGAGAAVVRGTTNQKWGAYSVLVTPGGGAACQYYESLTVAAAPFTLFFFARNAAGTAITGLTAWFNNASVTPTATAIGNGWYYYEYTGTPGAGARQFGVRMAAAAAGVYVDGFQLEYKAYATTYCDGDQGGCSWAAVPHASTSTRSIQSRAGGRVRNFDVYKFFPGQMASTGMPPVDNLVDEYALLPGGHVQGVKVQSRVLILTGTITGDSLADLHVNRQALINVLKPNAVPETAEGPQPVILRYTGAAVHKEIEAHYEGGLEAGIQARMDCWEQVAVRFLADDPYFYEIGDPAIALDTNDSGTFRYVAGRLVSTGQWDVLGPPNAAGAYVNVRAIVEDNVYVYFGGDFENFDNIANADHIVRYNKASGVWSALGTGTDDSVLALALMPNGNLFAGGLFHNAGGGAAAHIAEWNGAAWAALGAGVDDVVMALAVSQTGTLFAGGYMHNAGGAPAMHIAEWNGAAWAALGAGLDDRCTALGILPNENLIAGGYMHNAGGAPAMHIAEWNGAAWAALGVGTAGEGLAVAIYPDGSVVAGTLAAPFIEKWNGASWSGLGSGTDAAVYALNIASDGMLYLGGSFNTAGGIALTDKVAKWNGSTYVHLDLDLPGAPIVYAIGTCNTDPVVPSNYMLFIGFSTNGTAYFSGSVTPNNLGTEQCYPKLALARSGGTSAVIYQVRNETTGKTLSFNYSLLNGETLIVDLSPTKKSITSSFFGPRPDAILAASDMGTFVLQPGSNQITAFINVAGAPTITANLLWRNCYLSQD